MEPTMMITAFIAGLLNNAVLVAVLLLWCTLSDRSRYRRRHMRKKRHRVEKAGKAVSDESEDEQPLCPDEPRLQEEIPENLMAQEERIYPDMEEIYALDSSSLPEDMEILDLDETDLFDREDSDPTEIPSIGESPEEEPLPEIIDDPADSPPVEEHPDSCEDEFMRLMRSIRENNEEKERVNALDRDRDESRRQNMAEMDQAFTEKISDTPVEQNSASIDPALLRAKAAAQKEREEALRRQKAREEKRQRNRGKRHDTGKNQ